MRLEIQMYPIEILADRMASIETKIDSLENSTKGIKSNIIGMKRDIKILKKDVSWISKNDDTRIVETGRRVDRIEKHLGVS